MEVSMTSFALPRSKHRPWFGALRDLADELRHWRLRRRGRQLLLRFDERMLRDIGICPAQAEFEGRKPFWRD
jgi:uncharacterized protein YjiS (DUF1127 family)